MMLLEVIDGSYVSLSVLLLLSLLLSLLLTMMMMMTYKKIERKNEQHIKHEYIHKKLVFCRTNANDLEIVETCELCLMHKS